MRLSVSIFGKRDNNTCGKKLKSIAVQIKGVTYHNLDIHQREDGSWEATILFDI